LRRREFSIFYRPAALLARAEARCVERPVIRGSLDEVAEGTRDAGGLVAGVQTGLLRLYVRYRRVARRARHRLPVGAMNDWLATVRSRSAGSSTTARPYAAGRASLGEPSSPKA